MARQIIVFLMLVGMSMADQPNSYGQQRYRPVYKEAGKPYQFNYGVKDDYAGTDFGQTEESDGNTVRGSYSVQLPDGRKQTVTYVADHERGYQAEVTYYGEAQYPKVYGPPVTFKPQSYGQPQKSYGPRPSYRPQPIYQPKPSYS